MKREFWLEGLVWKGIRGSGGEGSYELRASLKCELNVGAFQFDVWLAEEEGGRLWLDEKEIELVTLREVK